MGKEEENSLRFLLAAVREQGCAKAGKRGRHREADIVCFFLFFCKALAPSKCLSHANKACLKLIELTEAASETKAGMRGKRGKRGEKGVRTRKRKTHYNPFFK